MNPYHIESRTASLCAGLKAVGIPADDLGCGLVDLMVDRRDGERHGELHLHVNEADDTVTLCTIWYEADDGGGGMHPADDTEHGTFNIEDVADIVTAIRNITGGAA